MHDGKFRFFSIKGTISNATAGNLLINHEYINSATCSAWSGVAVAGVQVVMFQGDFLTVNEWKIVSRVSKKTL